MALAAGAVRTRLLRTRIANTPARRYYAAGAAGWQTFVLPSCHCIYMLALSASLLNICSPSTRCTSTTRVSACAHLLLAAAVQPRWPLRCHSGPLCHMASSLLARHATSIPAGASPFCMLLFSHRILSRRSLLPLFFCVAWVLSPRISWVLRY